MVVGCYFPKAIVCGKVVKVQCHVPAAVFVQCGLEREAEVNKEEGRDKDNERV